ncbi:MAG TPA: acetyl-CoA hydrolase/transferase C-terminal domain-containing protein [Gammaproteobacteria bacterium]|nr:acetyl-CoA hydrolase/transferase C-terminal domain-containing protein [Gammaproteobacteria bacterium]
MSVRGEPQRHDDADACVEALLKRVGKRIVIGVPLGLGKPAHFLNALYRRVEGDRSLELEILTALTLEVPAGKTPLERRFLEPLCARLYDGYEPLAYAGAVRAGTLPPNINVSEFYFRPGAYMRTAYAQQRYLSANYSGAVRALRDRGINAIAQLVAQRASGPEARFSLGSNADLTLDLLSGAAQRPVIVAQTCRAMPFMPHDADTPASVWDLVLDHPRYEQTLFAVPNEPVILAHYAIAIHVASLIRDGGTLQIGIGSLADAVVHLIRMRQQDNPLYRSFVDCLIDDQGKELRSGLPVEVEPFNQGLYGCSEMLVEGFLHLARADVLKRRVERRAAPGGPPEIFLHSAFFLGSSALYRELRELPENVLQGIEMTGVDFVNTLNGDNELKSRQRALARFVNSAMMVTLNGAVVSDGVDDGRVVSGVGGQHDFVVMAHSLPDARSIIVLPSTRQRAGKAQSNVVFNYGHTTIPRHLRDIVVTEYGAADLRGKTDREVIAAMLSLSDFRFQEELLAEAKAAGKIEAGYRIPSRFARNTPESLEARLATVAGTAGLAHYPIGTDFDDDEARLAVALTYLKAHAGSSLAAAGLVLRRSRASDRARPLLERMRLDRPATVRDRLYRRLLIAALDLTEDGRPMGPRPRADSW